MTDSFSQLGTTMHEWCQDLFPINRSITGAGIRETLDYFKLLIGPKLSIKSIKSGTKVFDWSIPLEWNVVDAWIKDESGKIIVDLRDNNLHLVGYSEPVDTIMTLSDLLPHLHSRPDLPNAIPYVTSYYQKYWGFCITDNAKRKLKTGNYHVYINSSFSEGCINYGELIIPGQSEQEILLSTYICHPSMANNELSGPVVVAALSQWLLNQTSLKYTYRIIFIPETIGSIAYSAYNLNILKSRVIGGYVVTCIGDDGSYSFLPSRDGNTLSDKIARHVIANLTPSPSFYTWLDRGSDERQFCAPGIDLPIASIMRTKYGEYEQYHTSLDDLSFVTPSGLAGGYEYLHECISIFENNAFPVSTFVCEPQLGRRSLYSNISNTHYDDISRNISDVLSYCDGNHSILDISEKLSLPFSKTNGICALLRHHELIVF